MIYMYAYFVLTSINLICYCFIHVQQHAPPRIAGSGHPCYDRSLLILPDEWRQSFCNPHLPICLSGDNYSLKNLISQNKIDNNYLFSSASQMAVTFSECRFVTQSSESFNFTVKSFIYCIPRTKYVRGILWFSHRYAASASASTDTSSFSR